MHVIRYRCTFTNVQIWTKYLVLLHDAYLYEIIKLKQSMLHYRNNKFKQRGSTIPSISTKRTTTSHFKPMSIQNTTTYGIGNTNVHILNLDRHINVAVLNRLMGIIVYIYIYIYIYKQINNHGTQIL
jgi:hypothetical protein